MRIRACRRQRIHGATEVPEGGPRAITLKRTIDFGYDYPIGREELLGLAYGQTLTSGNIQRASGAKAWNTDPGRQRAVVPHVIETIVWPGTRHYSPCCAPRYTVDTVGDDERIVLKLPRALAPVKVAVSPLAKQSRSWSPKTRRGVSAAAKEVSAVMWDDNGNMASVTAARTKSAPPACGG